MIKFMEIFNKKSKKGFTLTECVVAISIIALITSVAVGSFISANNTTTRQWGNYLSRVMADNAVSSFGGVNDLNGFEKRMNNKIDKIKENIEGGEGAAVPTSVPFKTIRAYESGKVKLFDSSLDISKDTYTDAKAEFGYTDINKYKSDVHTGEKAFDKLTGIYTKNEHKTQSSGGYVTDLGSASFSYSDEGFGLKLEYNDLGLGYTGSNDFDIDKTWKMTAVEEYFFKKGQILGVPSTSGTPTDQIFYDGRNNYSANYCDSIYLYVYTMKEQSDGSFKLEHDKDSKGRWHAIEIVFKATELSKHGVKKDEICTESIHIESVKEGYVPNKDYSRYQMDWDAIQEITYKAFADGSKFENFDWGGLPLYAYFCDTLNKYIPEYDKISFQEIPAEEGELIYTDYTLKSGASISSLKIDYSLYKSDVTELYSKENDTLLFKYTGGDALSVLTTKFGFGENTEYGTQNGFKQYKIIVPESPTYGTRYYKYIPGGSKVGCLIKVAYTNKIGGSRKIDTYILPVGDINGFNESILESKTPYLSLSKG